MSELTDRLAEIRHLLDAADEARLRGDLLAARTHLALAKALRDGSSRPAAYAEAVREAEDRVRFLEIHAATMADIVATLPPPGAPWMPPAA